VSLQRERERERERSSETCTELKPKKAINWNSGHNFDTTANFIFYSISDECKSNKKVEVHISVYSTLEIQHILTGTRHST
jgi:hypothetical protein